MATNKTRRSFILALFFSASAFLPDSTLRATDGPQLASAEAKELWIKGSDQILAGDFNAGIKTIELIQKKEPQNREILSALDWMKQLEELNQSRDQYRQEMYDFYVKKALEAAKEAREGKPAGEKSTAAKAEKETKSMDKDKAAASAGDGESEEDEADDADIDSDEYRYKWSRALRYAEAAMTEAKDEDKFRTESWLPELVSNALLEIQDYKNANEFREALAIYDILQRIYPDNQDYKDGFEFCRKRAHLEFVYGSEKSNWRSDLDGVTPESVREILARIDQDYVEKPDFRKLSKEAIEHLTILAQSETLAKTFPNLGERDLVGQFVKRLEGFVKRDIDNGKQFGSRGVRRVFDNILDANMDTLRLPEEVVTNEFVSGLLEPLDEFTSIIWPTEVSEFNKQTRGEFVGVGIQITQEVGKPVRVESPLEDSPAYNAGIKPGDFILDVEGKKTSEMTITEAVRNITGEPGTTVVLTIKDGTTNEVREVELSRERIILHTVRGNTRDESKPTGWDYMVDQNLRVGYVRVSGFMDKTVPDLEKAINQLEDEGYRGLILDLRFNPGGLLNSARDMCDLFLPEDAPIVKTKGRDRGQNITLRAQGKHNRHKGVPIIILVNEYSASASEIVSGALSGLKEACIVGTRSFGKGSVQNLIPIVDAQAYLKLTTAHYYVPDADMPGNDPWYLLHRKPGAKTWGVEPHIVVKTIPQETAKILRLRRERDVLKGKGQTGDVPKEVLERKPTSMPSEKLPEDPNPDMDPQFITALNVMRMKLMSEQPWALAPRTKRTALSAANPSSKVTRE